ncbi:MAG: hemerythrin family protein [Magnetovibrio sp.]|nr:hemerythrin family protein [Magnetovibrio sp.]
MRNTVKIVETINYVSQAIEKGDYDTCSVLLDDFLEICTNHFETEENLLASLNFPNLHSHIVFHRELILKAKSVRVLCMDKNDPNSLSHCFDEMAALLVEDVIKGDLSFVPFLVDKGVAKPRDPVMPILKRVKSKTRPA